MRGHAPLVMTTRRGSSRNGYTAAHRAVAPPARSSRRLPWTTPCARSAPTTSTRATTGHARCRRSAPWGSISRSGSIIGGCTAIGSSRVKQALENSELGALLVFDVNNIRYITSTKIGEWERDKLCRWALLTRDGDPILWDFGSAAVHHKLYTPWLKPENCKAGLIGLRGTVNPAFGLMERHAKEIASLLKEAGVHNMPVGVDIIEPPMMFELQKAGLKVVDGQQTMLEARELKNIDEIALLNRAAAMVDGAYHLISEELKPGVRENDIVAKVNEFLYRHGSDDVEAINAISGERCNPHPHNFTDRMLRPGDQAFFDILQSFMGYRTCYYRTFNVGRATPVQHDAYKKAREWLDNAIALIKPGVTTDKICKRLAEGAGFRLSGRDVRFRPAVRPRSRSGAARAADHLAGHFAHPSDRDQGRHGVRARDLLPGDRRLLGRAHRGGGRGHRQGLQGDHAVSGRGTADQPPILNAQSCHEAPLPACGRDLGCALQRTRAPGRSCGWLHLDGLRTALLVPLL